ncbi:MAG: DUF1385 domain-containing protein [Lachnospiraceae bacterium]|nr:DUF1385 domain-containing protein [Lachnospiraceae bacterium]
MKRTSIGGQAVMEGVMMKNMDKYAVAVRKPDQKIEVKTGEFVSFCKRYKVLSLPILRGIVTFAESLYIGMKTLTYSASFFEEEEESQPGKFELFLTKVFGEKMESVVLGLTLLASLVMAIGLFMLLPFWLSDLTKSVVHSNTVRIFIEGLIRVALFLIYVWAISKMEDIKRVFMYHGAEHKTINCLESGEELTPENVMKHSRLHKRCGTSFLLIVMIISIFVFMFIQSDSLLVKFLMRIVLVPLVAGISYEFIRLAGRSNNKIVCALSKPGLSLQYLTTKEPDLSMLEVAIASVEGVFDWRAYQEAMRNGEIED